MNSSAIQSTRSITKSRKSDYASLIPQSYVQARDRFLTAASKLGAKIESLQIAAKGPQGEDLWVDAALLGASQPGRLLIISSGVHGIEGFFGSAVQTGFLEDELRGAQLPADGGLLMLHAINPYGFAWYRRFNENNVDLNRNFLLPDEPFSGSPPLYSHLYKQYPATIKPRRFSLLLVGKLLFTMLRHGKKQLRAAVPVGQYDYPKGPFFGGAQPEKIQLWLRDALQRWLQNAKEVVHLDFHTGLGAWGACKLLIDHDPESSNCDWWKQHFNPASVECVKRGNTSYLIRGAFGRWCEHLAGSIPYRFATAEFGTRSPMRVLAAIISENRAYWCGLKANPHYAWIQKRMMEAFVPSDRAWRENSIQTSMDLVQQAWISTFQAI